MVNLKSIISKTSPERRAIPKTDLKAENTPTVSIQNPARKTYWAVSLYVIFKGIIDRIAALLAIILLLPILILIALIIRLETPGNPVFSQERVGLYGRRFTAYKYRTMQANNDDSAYKAYLKQYILQDAPYKVKENGEKVFKLVDDPRITRVGAILRKTNLDELPQLINILKGEMSFIGPRPDIPYSVNMYNDWHRQRLKVMPGITGLWQVGHRKELSFNEMVQIDLEYTRKVSLFLDLKIVLLTIRTIFMGDGS